MLWAVNYAIRETDVFAVQAAVANVLEADRYSIITELLEDGEEGTVQLALTVDAGSLSGAISVAAGYWSQLQIEAEVSKAAAHLDFIVGPLDGSAPFHDVLLRRAAQLLGGGEPAHALVAAVSAYEVYERQVVRDLAARDMSAELANSVWALYKQAHRNAKQGFLENLVGQKLEAAGQPWIDYKASLRSRQAIVHEGAVVDDATAATAVTAIRALISWIEKAAQSRA